MRALAAALVLLLPGLAAGADGCPPAGTQAPRPTLELTGGSVETAWHNEVPKAGITRMAGREPANEGLFNTGLTRTGTQLRINPEIWWVELGQGRTCLGLGRVTATWRIEQMDVDIAAEYPPGSCQYKVVREHEGEHVVLTRQTFDAFVPEMRARLGEAVARTAPLVTTEDPDTAGHRLVDRLMAEARPVLDAYDRERARVNAAIDTTESYRRSSARCPEW
ncbi:MAG: hypothetical protein ACM31L_06635 [Actinomycetota bacterium]